MTGEGVVGEFERLLLKSRINRISLGVAATAGKTKKIGKLSPKGETQNDRYSMPLVQNPRKKNNPSTPNIWVGVRKTDGGERRNEIEEWRRLL